ncbi:hypothetical protein QYF61_005225 [Mycteria americana]|uniref:Uncharacterized protein n=1 Tax=Mycteria americana TaxID=33587 RepID=A0AAN7NRB9_MYCAM|nr:hypothetical protein QYF61_005225 [Mycteria americana]
MDCSAWRREGSGAGRELDLIRVCKNLTGGRGEEGARLLSVVPTDRTRGNEHNLVVKRWNRLPREVVKSPPVEILKTQLDIALSNLLYLTLLEQEGWTRQSQEAPSNLNDPVN